MIDRQRNDSYIERESALPVQVAARYRHLPSMVFFDSVGNLPSNHHAPISIIAACPLAEISGSIHAADDLNALRDLMQVHSARQSKAADVIPHGGMCGSIEYDGNFSFGVYPEWLVYDHASLQWHGQPEWAKMPVFHRDDSPCKIGQFTPSTSRERFIQTVNQAREWIAAGDIYQVNLTQQFRAECSPNAELWTLYEALRAASPAPMSCWMQRDGKQVLSSSPETFLHLCGRDVETRPIKGTRPRFADQENDRRSAHDLQTSPKEISELVMITDLLRNDLGQVCEFGSVRVSQMLQLESLAQVHHLVSTVNGKLAEGEDVFSLLAACFPGGSITGAPKKRAMEIIQELESVPRGLYCGAMGYIDFSGNAQFNIAIRTLIHEKETLHYHVGAGIVADSNAEAEYLETLHKARGIQQALAAWQNISISSPHT